MGEAGQRRRQVVRVWLIPGITGLLIAAVPVVFGSHLPDKVAVHWTGSGFPDGNLPLNDVVVLLLGLAAATWATMLFTRFGTPTSLWGRFALAYFILGMSLGLMAMTVFVNFDASYYVDATAGGTMIAWLLILPLLLGGAFAVVGACLSPSTPAGSSDG